MVRHPDNLWIIALFLGLPVLVGVTMYVLKRSKRLRAFRKVRRLGGKASMCDAEFWITFDLSATAVTDEDLHFLSTCRECHALLLRDTQVTDDAVESIARIDSLELLDLSRTGIKARLLPLSRLRNLRHLVIARTAVDDLAVEQLLSLPALEILDIQGTSMSYHSVVRMCAARPGLSVYSSFGRFGPALRKNNA